MTRLRIARRYRWFGVHDLERVPRCPSALYDAAVHAVWIGRSIADRIRLENLIAGKDDYFRAKGVVVETLPNATFRVKLETGHEVTARASGKMRKGRMIRIIPGDSVEVDVSAYDPSMGRIVWRYR